MTGIALGILAAAWLLIGFTMDRQGRANTARLVKVLQGAARETELTHRRLGQALARTNSRLDAARKAALGEDSATQRHPGVGLIKIAEMVLYTRYRIRLYYDSDKHTPVVIQDTRKILGMEREITAEEFWGGGKTKMEPFMEGIPDVSEMFTSPRVGRITRS